MPTRQLELRLLLCLALPLGACAAQKDRLRMEAVTMDHAPAPSAPPERLTRSLFHKPFDRDNLSEEVIQRVIDAPLEPEFPARAGVLVLDAPFSAKQYTSLCPGDEAPQILARRLETSRHFVVVSDISPYLVRGQGIEALRELATRYRLKYLVIFNRRFVDRSHLNRWGWFWLSLVGIPFVPAYTLEKTGLLEATLMDVRTGTFLFTTQVHVAASRRSTPWSKGRKLGDLELSAAKQAATRLASRFLEKCRRLAQPRSASQPLARAAIDLPSRH